MKKRLTSAVLVLAMVLTLFSGLTLTASAETEAAQEIDFTAQGYSNGYSVSTINGDLFTITFDKGTNSSNPPKYYTTGSAIRLYAGNTMSVAVKNSENKIKKIELTVTQGSASVDVGSLSDSTWTGENTFVTFTNSTTDNTQWRIRKIKVTVSVAGGGDTPSVSSIEVTSAPSYHVGDDLTTDGWVITANYSDSTSAAGLTPSSVAFKAGSSMAEGTQTVLVSYGGITIDHDITVLAAPVYPSTLTAGEKIIIAYLPVGDTGYELTGISGNVGTATEIESTPRYSYPLEIIKNDDGTYSFKDSDNKYIAYTKAAGTTKNNNLFLVDSIETNGAKWNVTDNEDGTFTLENAYNNERKLRFNTTSGQERFCCYTTSTGSDELHLIPVPKFTSASLTLNESIAVNYYADLSADSYSSFYVAFHGPYEAVGVTVSADFTPYVDGATTYYRATYNVNMKEYASEVTGQLMRKVEGEDDIAIGDPLDYGVTNYITDASSGSAATIVAKLEQLCQLVAAYFADGSSDSLSVTDHKLDLAAYAPTINDDGDTASLYGITLLMEETVVLRVYVKLDGAKTATVDGESGKTLTQYAPGSSYYYYDFTGVGRSQLKAEHTISIDGTAFSISNLTPLAYAYRVVDRGNYTTDSTLYKLVCALYEYALAS